MNSNDDGVYERRRNVTTEDLKEDTLLNFIEDVNNMVVGVNFANSNSNPSSSGGKRKEVQQFTKKSG